MCLFFVGISEAFERLYLNGTALELPTWNTDLKSVLEGDGRGVQRWVVAKTRAAILAFVENGQGV